MEYKITRTNDDELMHYGVLGMKWGVHRSTGYNQQKEQRRADKALKKDMRDRSRTAANLERQAKYYDSKSSKALSKAIKYDNKITKELEKHPYKSTDKEPRKVAKLSNKLKKANAEHDNNRAAYERMNEYRNVAVKGLSEKQIQKGRNYINKAAALGMALGSWGGREVAIALDNNRTKKFIDNYERSKGDKKVPDNLNKNYKKAKTKREKEDAQLRIMEEIDK